MQKKSSWNCAYLESHCEKIIGWREHGWSVAECCAALDVNKATYYDWVQQRPEFAVAASLGDAKYEAFWCKDIRDNRLDRNYNAQTIRMQMANNLKWGDNPKNQLVTLDFKSAKTHEQKTELLNTALASGILTTDQYKELQQAISLEFDRAHGMQILAAEEALRKLQNSEQGK